MRLSLSNARLYGIVDFGYVEETAVAEVTGSLLKGGADVIQLRAKGIPLETISAAAEKIIPLCKTARIPFILNDYPEMAVTLGADGVHIGQDDGTIADVRKLVGEEMIIGRSTHSLPQARQALEDEADYIGFGPFSHSHQERPSGHRLGRSFTNGSGSRETPARFLHRRHQAGEPGKGSRSRSTAVRGGFTHPPRKRHCSGNIAAELLSPIFRDAERNRDLEIATCMANHRKIPLLLQTRFPDHGSIPLRSTF